MYPKLSVVIPARNAAHFLARCLQALAESGDAPHELIVVDDGSTDDTREVAAAFGATIISNPSPKGPAFARNLGAKTATGDILFFLDSDVCVKRDTLSKIGDHFAKSPQLAALIGSYDNAPAEKDFISQYRNLMHAYVHQTGVQKACTFWSGCGAIRHSIFVEHSGFNENYGRPAIEDIELGYRLTRAGCNITLDPKISVTHLKRWTFWGLVKTDILDRGIPWTELIFRDRFMPNDLNLQLSQRVSVALVFLLVCISAAMAVRHGIYLLLPPFVFMFLILAGWWGKLGSYKQPGRAYAMATTMVAIIVALAYYLKMYGLIPPLVICPVLLVLRHRYSRRGRTSRSTRIFGIAFICFALIASALYEPPRLSVFLLIAVLALLGVLNSQFYIFLAGKRGLVFMLAAIPFHLLYHFYSGVSFVIGASRHYWMTVFRKHAAVTPPAGLLK